MNPFNWRSEPSQVAHHFRLRSGSKVHMRVIEARNMSISQSTKSHKELAAEHGLSLNRLRDLRKQLREGRNVTAT